MIVEARVPLKLTLFGEHAVVYGKPAIAATISEFLKVRVSPSEKFVVVSPSLNLKGVKVNLDDMRVENEQVSRLLNYVSESLSAVGDVPVKIEIESPVEPSVGLGTSAAVIVGTISAYSSFLGQDLTPMEIARKSHEVELRVQGIGSRMDTYVESLGGIILFNGNKEERIHSDISFVSGYFRRSMTTAEMLKKVKEFKDQSVEVFSKIIDSIGSIVMEAKEYMEENKETEVGRLMYVNHGLLFSLGVTVPEIDEAVSRARYLGIKGAKISGGGAGGSVIMTSDPASGMLLRSFGAYLINSRFHEGGVTVSKRTE
ncbi:mevalonate kinase [Sulfuracidifex tepidarius]|uniref:Mevalonate kinase n=1 Tax=Sulfuracidifex tepidarius TaxID=1294262 RepID=A0A510DVC8_9CREN|nr:mevalonate kinase [Sulfuracidifex tepidarius]BBG24171.1 Mevalonate kinase [Sulfuracidifex tepidarius]BBG26928.1 Mevalonate kinase [Sulfuracidifex tepidarius]